MSDRRAQPEDLTDEEKQAVSYGRAHLLAIAFIERHLFDELDLERIAKAAGYSESEFSRRFTRMQGESVMAYVRGRRLQHAARRFAQDPAASILDVALECGFESQAAFTRAFTRAFGAPPGRTKKEGSPRARRRKKTTSLTLAERVEDIEPLVLWGLRGRFTPTNFANVGGLFEQLVALRQAAGGSRREETFGVIEERAPDGSFTLFAASRAWTDPAPSPLERAVVPAGRCVVLRMHRMAGPLLPQLTAAEEAVSTVRMRLKPVCEFQHYPPDFGLPGGWIDHYLLVSARVAGPSG